MLHLKTFRAIDEHCKKFHGVTLKIPSCQVIIRKTGYFVSINGGQNVALKEWDSCKLSDFIIDNLDRFLHDGLFLGIWKDEGTIYLDLTIWIRGYSKALLFGRNNGQRAIYSCKNGKAIEL